MALIGAGIFLTLIDLYGGYKLHEMLWAILELPVIALILCLRWRKASKENSN
jgi:hypothetical protein